MAMGYCRCPNNLQITQISCSLFGPRRSGQLAVADALYKRGGKTESSAALDAMLSKMRITFSWNAEAKLKIEERVWKARLTMRAGGGNGALKSKEVRIICKDEI